MGWIKGETRETLDCLQGLSEVRRKDCVISRLEVVDGSWHITFCIFNAAN